MTYMHKHIVKPGETLFSIAEDYRIAFNTLLQANQLADPNTLYVGQTLVIPGLPAPDQLPYSISVSLLNRTLTLFQHGAEVKTYPIAVGRMLNETPTGDYVIINKAPNPGGPFGAMWMSLSKKHYGIHGTNDPSSIGKAVSKGCIRMFNEDVIELSQMIPIGTKVLIRP